MGSSQVLHPPRYVHPMCGEPHGDVHLGKSLKACMAWSWVLSVSVIGGLMLGLWASWYHPNNSQLWMVPFGLVLLITPFFAWTSVIASEMCCHVFANSQVQGHHKHPSNEPLV